MEEDDLQTVDENLLVAGTLYGQGNSKRFSLELPSAQ